MASEDESTVGPHDIGTITQLTEHKPVRRARGRPIGFVDFSRPGFDVVQAPRETPAREQKRRRK